MKKEGEKLLAGLDAGEYDDMLNLLIASWLQSIQDGINGRRNPVYDEVKKIFNRNKVEGCYFCDDAIDPNEEEFNLDKKLCMFCQLKVANILASLGIDHTKLFPLAGARNVQKTQIRGRMDGLS